MSDADSALQNSDTFLALESHTMPRTVSVPRAVSQSGKTWKGLKLSARTDLEALCKKEINSEAKL